MPSNYRKIYSIQKENERKILELFPACPAESGIYMFWRADESGLNYAYIGQAKNILSRVASHLSGYQHIDISLRKRGFFDRENNQYGWNLATSICPEAVLDEEERRFILYYAADGFQLLNKESGGKSGKTALENRKPPRTYRQGVEQGQKNTKVFLQAIFNNYLDAKIKDGVSGRRAANALKKFNDFIESE